MGYLLQKVRFSLRSGRQGRRIGQCRPKPLGMRLVRFGLCTSESTSTTYGHLVGGISYSKIHFGALSGEDCDNPVACCPVL